MCSQRIVIGARGSPLSQIQVEEVASCIKNKFPECKVIIKTFTTRGDRRRDGFSVSPGIFVKEIEEALIAGDIDIAVHSLKDLPTLLPSCLVLEAVLERKSPFDVFLAKKGCKLGELTEGSRIGTSSLRRKAQILYVRPDVKVVPLRGNVDTRIRKLKGDDLDGIVCALVAIERLKLDIKGEVLCSPHFIPAPGQGALGIEVRKDDIEIREIVRAINHRDTYLCVSAERMFLAELGGGCRLPVGALAQIEGRDMVIEGFVASASASSVIYVKKCVPIEEARNAGRLLAQEAIRRGAEKILKEVKGG